MGLASSLDRLWSALRACLSSRSLTGVAWPSRAAFAPATVITLPLVVRRALGMPRFSARLLAMAGLAMAGCGRRRWVRGADVGGELVRADGVLDVEEVVEEVVALVDVAAVEVVVVALVAVAAVVGAVVGAAVMVRLSASRLRSRTSRARR